MEKWKRQHSLRHNLRHKPDFQVISYLTQKWAANRCTIKSKMDSWVVEIDPDNVIFNIVQSQMTICNSNQFVFPGRFLHKSTNILNTFQREIIQYPLLKKFHRPLPGDQPLSNANYTENTEMNFFRRLHVKQATSPLPQYH